MTLYLIYESDTPPYFAKMLFCINEKSQLKMNYQRLKPVPCNEVKLLYVAVNELLTLTFAHAS